MKLTRTLLLTLISLAAAALAGCETTATEPAQASAVHLPEDLPPPTDRCFRTRNIRSFEVLDERTLVIKETRSRAYLVRLRGRCPGLKFARGLGFDTRDQRVCGNRPETLLVPGAAVPTRCFVASIHEGSEAQFLGEVEDWQRGETTEEFPGLEQEQEEADQPAEPEPPDPEGTTD